MFEYGREYTQGELPGELFNASSGEVRYYGGVPYKIVNTGRGTRILQTPSGTESGLQGADKTVPAFNFDWEAARKAAFDPDNPQNSVLGRYYLQKLKDAGNDVERAKRLIVEDYDRGVREATEDYTLGEKYRGEDLISQMAEFNLDTAKERRETIAGANTRGVLFGEIPQGQEGAKAPYSEYAKEYILNPMDQRQALRKQAIERAIQRQSEVAGIEKARTTQGLTIAKERGLEEQNIQFPRTQQALQEETREKAYTQQVPLQYQEAYQKYRALQGLPER